MISQIHQGYSQQKQFLLEIAGKRDYPGKFSVNFFAQNYVVITHKSHIS